MVLVKTITELRTLRGTVGRADYAALGTILFLLKCVLDHALAPLAIGRAWSFFNYLNVGQAQLMAEASRSKQFGFTAMFFIAIPFLWVGIVLTLKRLRDARLPLWLVILFFAPVINVLFFLALCLIRSRGAKDTERQAPGTVGTSAAYNAASLRSVAGMGIALAFTTTLGWLLVGFNVYALGIYGAGLFVGLPFCLGIIAAVIYGYYGARSWWGCAGVAFLSVLTLAAVLFGTGFEGLGCLLMAAPIWLICSMIGAVVGYLIQRHARDERETALLVISLTLAVPALMGAEHAAMADSPLYAVRSAIEIDASADRVWRHVISFPELPPPTERMFHMGIAFPIGATIERQGIGAERRCRFSTGSFIEPIEIWEEPRLLRFSVTSNPPPMEEWSIYKNVHAPHLEGFLVSRAGQFLLTRLPGGRTRLEGTTWYYHNMQPAEYWRLWSDYIIHTIHFRVLNHVRSLSEAKENFASAQP